MSAEIYRIWDLRRYRERMAEQERKRQAEAERSARFRRLTSWDDDVPPGGDAA